MHVTGFLVGIFRFVGNRRILVTVSFYIVSTTTPPYSWNLMFQAVRDEKSLSRSVMMLICLGFLVVVVAIFSLIMLLASRRNKKKDAQKMQQSEWNAWNSKIISKRIFVALKNIASGRSRGAKGAKAPLPPKKHKLAISWRLCKNYSNLSQKYSFIKSMINTQNIWLHKTCTI